MLSLRRLRTRLRFVILRVRDISLFISAGLGEFRIRDLNDEINKLIREKSHWEAQIKELGGKDYARVGPKMFDNEGREVPGNRGYKYFGAAKDLPGQLVRLLRVVCASGLRGDASSNSARN